MREHREAEHERSFELDRHVSYPGHPRKRAPMTYGPSVQGRPARFHCRLCPGQVFLVGDLNDYSDPEAQARWLRHNPAAAPGIRSLPAKHRGRAIGAHQSGEVQAHAYEQWLSKNLQRTVPKGRRAKDAARIEGCQRQMLRERLEGKLVAEIIEGLCELQAKDPESWRRLTGGEATASEKTLYRYWHDIPKPVRGAAEQAAEAETNDGEVAALRERLLAALSP
jgi:hypothetical protein